MDKAYHRLDFSIHRIGESYQLELVHTDPDSQAQIAPVRAPASFDLDELRSLEGTPAYGEALTRQLFADKDIEERFLQVETASQATGGFIRLALCIDPSAQELQALRWELLVHPRTKAALAVSETMLLSRFMVSRDWRPIKLRARTQLRVLIVVAAPPAEDLARLQLAAIDFDAEVERVERVLDRQLATEVLGGPDSPVTIDRTLEQLRNGFDIVYFVAHGKFGRSTGTPALVLQDDTGKATIIKADDLVARMAELQRPPRLMILVSCQSAGDGGQLEPGHRTSVQATLAGRLADAGVPAVLGMQGYVSMTTIERMMPVFFTELLRDGQIDRALAVARGVVRDAADAWMPALFTRLKTGRIWYTPGFADDRGVEVWRRLLQPVQYGKVVPILGPRLLEDIHGGWHETARRLAKAIQFPLAPHQRDDLPSVTEYLRVKESRFNAVHAYQAQVLEDLIQLHRSWLPASELPPQAKPRLGKLLALVGDHLRETDPGNPHKLLAELPASFYVTTNFDPLLERALKANDRDPQQVVSRWRYQKPPLSADEQPVSMPNVKQPMVYHVFGAFGSDGDERVVLTEDDHFDYLIANAANQLMPAMVESALVDNSLLFLGFGLMDWHFRVLFRLMMNLPGRERLKQYCHVAVQVDPDLQTMTDVEATKAYLSEYFGQEANIDIYWGSAQEFLQNLHDELARAGQLEPEVTNGEDDDEWNF